jgi:micrococcal nuclease
VSHNGRAAECFGDAATQELGQLTPLGSTVTLTPDTGQALFDRYGRLLRYVDRDGIDVGQKLLRRGAAKRYRNRPLLEREDIYTQAAKRAKSQPVGLWKSC